MPVPERAAPPRSPSDAIARTDAARYGPPVLGGGAGRPWRLKARLLGGAADGRSVQLESLIDAIAVYVVDDITIGCDRSLPRTTEGRFVGTYRLASGVGPEPPVYVAGV